VNKRHLLVIEGFDKCALDLMDNISACRITGAVDADEVRMT
jgi:hypothetical protein